MYEISIQTYFSAAHSLRNYQGKCEQLHGHNWKVEVTVASEMLDATGLVMDFAFLKQKTDAVIEHLDHQYLNQIPYFTTTNPSSENIAAYLFSLLEKELQAFPVTLLKVSVWESEHSRASFSPPKVHAFHET